MTDYIEVLSNSSIESIDNCIICFYPLENEIAELTCGHKFHFDCLKNWTIKNKNFCCICDKDNIEIKNVYSLDDSITETNLDNKEIVSPGNSDICIEKGVSGNLGELFLCCNIL